MFLSLRKIKKSVCLPYLDMNKTLNEWATIKANKIIKWMRMRSLLTIYIDRLLLHDNVIFNGARAG